MNWGRGLFRVWAVLASLWVVVVGAIGTSLVIKKLVPIGLLELMGAVCGPPLALLLVGALGFWAAKGFRAK